jgi:lysophospholipase L1-like esterase
LSNNKKYLTGLYAACFMLMLLNRLNAQLSNFDTSYINTYYLQKMSIYDVVPDSKNEIIFLGNSITDIGHWEEFFGTTNIKNRGISSDITYGVLHRLSQITRVKPAKIFIMIGINDIARNIPDSIIISNYQKIVQRIKSESPLTKIYIQSILPTNNDFTEYQNHQNKTGHILNINEYLRSLAKKTDEVYIDLYGAMIDKEGKLDKKYTNDGLHLTAAGFLQWKKVLETGKYCCDKK